MVEITPATALLAAGGSLAAAEATGVTNFVGSQQGKKSDEKKEKARTRRRVNNLLGGRGLGLGLGGSLLGSALGAGQPLNFSPDITVESGGQGVTPTAQDGGFLGRGGVLTSGQSTDGLVPSGLGDDSTMSGSRGSGDGSRGSGDRPFASYPFDTPGFQADVVTEKAENTGTGLIGGIGNRLGDIAEGAAAGAGVGLAIPIPLVDTAAGAAIGGTAGALGIDVSDAAGNAVSGAANFVTGGGSGGSKGKKDIKDGSGATRDVDTSSSEDITNKEAQMRASLSPSQDEFGESGGDVSSSADDEDDVDASKNDERDVSTGATGNFTPVNVDSNLQNKGATRTASNLGDSSVNLSGGSGGSGGSKVKSSKNKKSPGDLEEKSGLVDETEDAFQNVTGVDPGGALGGFS